MLVDHQRIRVKPGPFERIVVKVHCADRVSLHHVAGPAVAVIGCPMVFVKLKVDRCFYLFFKA